jgi:hypothetical protein
LPIIVTGGQQPGEKQKQYYTDGKDKNNVLPAILNDPFFL